MTLRRASIRVSKPASIPRASHANATTRDIFAASDITQIGRVVGRGPVQGTEKDLVAQMNVAAREALIVTDMGDPSPAELEEFTRRVAVAAGNLVAALGLVAGKRPLQEPASSTSADGLRLDLLQQFEDVADALLPGARPTQSGLPHCEAQSIIARRASTLAVPETIRQTALSAWHLFDVSARASAHYAALPKKGRGRRKQQVESGRTIFLALVIDIYERAFGSPVDPSAGSTSSFVKFSHWALNTLAQRVGRNVRDRGIATLSEGATAKEISNNAFPLFERLKQAGPSSHPVAAFVARHGKE
ncbi:MAG: hypothetical protein GEV13_09450 [Rhodospirillales bacterium]|nr:hypothetical protein [Rhodospirillales bacterium]